MKTNTCPITLVGASQSGKTTLAAGLAKTSDEAFTVGFADEATRDYLQPRIANISSGRWPEATLGENFDISLNLNAKGGRTATIAFKEYMGEKIRDQTYMEDIVGKPRGALILMSPGMDILRDAARREEMIANLKSIIDYLKKNHCVAVAFVVTACDRLKTDLADFAPRFKEYAAEVTNYLNTSGMVWKRFYVTITGELKNQNEPTIAAGDLNTSREPFIWIMDRVAGRKRMLMAKHVSRLAAGIIAAALVAAAAGYGIMYNQDSAKLKAVENNATAALDEIVSAEKKRSESGLKAGTDNLNTAITEAKGLSVRFAKLDTRRKDYIQDWQGKYDTKRAVYLDKSMDKREESKTTNGSEENCEEFDKVLDAFKPADTKLKNELEKRWKSLRPQIRKAYDESHGDELDRELAELRAKPKDDDLLRDLNEFKSEKIDKWTTQCEAKNELIQKVSELREEISLEIDTRQNNSLTREFDDMNTHAADKATAEGVESLRQKITDWDPSTGKGRTMKQKLMSNFDNSTNKWQTAYSDNTCTKASYKIVREIHALDLDDQNLNADDVCATLRKAFGFGQEYAAASPQVLAVATNEIFNVYTNFLRDFEESFVKVWDIKAREAPEISGNDKRFIETALNLPNPDKPEEKLSVVFLEKLEVARTEAEGKWRNAKKEICDKFIADTFTSGRSAVSIFDAYRRWYNNNANNPSVEMVDKKVEEELAKYFSWYVDNWYKEFRGKDRARGSWDNALVKVKAARQQFDDFKRLCLALAKDPCGISTKSQSVVFARLCRDKGDVDKGFDRAFEQKLTVTGIDIQVDFHKTSGSFKGLSVGCSAEVTSCDPMGNIKCEDSYVFRAEDRGYTIEKRSNGIRQHLFNGKREFSTNPWKYVILDLPMEDRVGFGHANRKLSHSWSLWGLENEEVALNCRIKSEHEDGNLDADITLYVQGSANGPTLYGLWEEAAKEAAR